jgi:hypothetical protein
MQGLIIKTFCPREGMISSSMSPFTQSCIPLIVLNLYHPFKLMAIFDGKILPLNDVIFFKTSQLLPLDIAAQINFPWELIL